MQTGQYKEVIVTYLKPQKRRTILLGAIILGSIGMQLLNPQFVKNFIDGAKSGATTETLVGFGLLFLGATLMNQILVVLAAWQGAHVGWVATNMLRRDLAEHILKLEMSFHNNRTPGELIERVDGDITAIANFFSQFVVRVAGAAVLILGVIVVVTLEDWRMGLGVSVYAIVTFLVLFRMKDVAVNASKSEREVSASAYGFIEERLAGIEDIRANGGGPFALRSLQKVLRQMLLKGRQAWMRRSRFWFVLITLFSLGDVVALGLGSELLFSGSISLGAIVLFYMYAQILWQMVEQIIQQMADLQKAGAGIERVGMLMRITPTMVDPEEEQIVALPEGPLSVEFRDLSFSYNDEDMILNGLSFELKPGRVLGLLGRTGSGKTTLTRLLFRLYDPTKGEILIGGVDPRQTERKLLRSRIAMVTQEVQLFHASVRDNLTFFDPRIPDEAIMEVIGKLGLREWFDRLPEGLDTTLEAGGGGLSAGEGQLLAFTRVFLHDPGLVILDEPSSRLDPATERLLENAMVELLKDRTGIIIAHRLSTVSRADEIMVMENGSIVEHDDRELLEQDPNSRFAGLLKTAGMDESAFESELL